MASLNRSYISMSRDTYYLDDFNQAADAFVKLGLFNGLI
jgi:hypothetical protein